MPYIKAKNGNVIEADKSLAKALLAQGHAGPFKSRTEALSASTGADAGNKPLSALTVAELKAYAEEREIALGDATKKADVLAAIEAAAEDDGETSDQD